MKAFLILEDGTVFTGTSIGSTRDMISEIVFNTSMTGYLEVLTDPSYAGQAVVMTYPLIGNYGITPDMESRKAWPDGYIVRELSRMPSNFRCEGTIQDFLKEQDIPGIAGVDTRALTKILREKGTMNGMITTNENYNLEEILPKLKAYTVGDVVSKVTCSEKYVLEGTGKKVALLDLGAKNNIAKSLNQRGCEVTVYPAHTTAEEIISSNPDGIMLSNGPGDPADCTSIIEEIKKLYNTDIPIDYTQVKIRTSRWKSSGQRPSDKSCIYFFSESRLCGRCRKCRSKCGSACIYECQRWNKRGTCLCRKEHLYRTVPSGSMPGTTGFRLPV